MRRRLGTTALLVTLVSAIALGTGSGLAARQSHSGGGPERSRSSDSPPRARSTRSPVLTAANVLTAVDLSAAGWSRVRRDTIINGTAQFAKVCDRHEPSADGIVTATYANSTGEFGQQSSYTFGVPPQASSTYRQIVRLYANCKGSSVRRLPTPPGVNGGVWHITGGRWGSSYAVVVRVGDRIGWASLYDDDPAVDPAAVPRLATALQRRLDD